MECLLVLSTYLFVINLFICDWIVISSSIHWQGVRIKHGQYVSSRAWLRMDDERYREGIKSDLTVREDEYFSSRFKKLSASGHNLSPTEHLEDIRCSGFYHTTLKSFQQKEPFLGTGRRGLYVCNHGGLPLFASGCRIDAECNSTLLVFNEACDPEHITTAEPNFIRCARSGEILGYFTNGKFLVNATKLCFLPLDVPWPTMSQPENVWGSEGQYRAWNLHERSSRPLTY